MTILIVDDNKTGRIFLSNALGEAGFKDIITAESATDAFEKLGIGSDGGANGNIDLILMDVVMPGINGIEACSTIKGVEELKDIPIVMVTSMDAIKGLKPAFDAGAIDYIGKPPNSVELETRVKALLKLKSEIDARKARERELLAVTLKLEEANEKLHSLSSTDGLTGIPNRRSFDQILESEIRRAQRNKSPLTLMLGDIDFFKPYNDCYGHTQGDSCLQQVARAFTKVLKRPGDIAARYGGEEYAFILPNTPESWSVLIAEKLRSSIEALQIPHSDSQVSQYVTMSFGVVTGVPDGNMLPKDYINAADKALYRAKEDGRNQVSVSEDFQ